MRFLLDTHTLLWLRADDPRLSRAKWESVLFAPGNEVLVSMVSLWEIAIKRSLGRLEFDGDLSGFGRTLETRHGFRLLALACPHLDRLARLPFHHRDPFDRLLIAQAIEEGAIAVTDDRNWRKYPVKLRW